MKTLAIAFLIAILALPAHAQRTHTILATPTSFDGENGHALRIDSPGDDLEDFFFIDNGGLVEFFGWRLPPALFESLGGNQYIVPVTVGDVTPGMSFWFIEGDCDLQLATYVGMVEVSVPAGTFMTYQFNVPDSCTSGFEERFYWADGVGLVRLAEYSNDVFQQAWVLVSYTINGGSGLFPRAVGNVWEYTEGLVPVEDSTVGALKASFAD